MTIRILLCGVCALALQVGSSFAQTLASVNDSPVAEKPLAIDKTSKATGDIPEIIRQPDQDQSQPVPRSIADPRAVLQPPVVDLRFLRAIGLDWDRVGETPRLPASSRTAANIRTLSE
jgi:hypothetical protein